jgi:hypothetical protein
MQHGIAFQILVGLLAGFALGVIADCMLIALRPSVGRYTVGVGDYLRCMVVWYSTSSIDAVRVVVDRLLPDDDD